MRGLRWFCHRNEKGHVRGALRWIVYACVAFAVSSAAWGGYKGWTEAAALHRLGLSRARADAPAPVMTRSEAMRFEDWVRGLCWQRYEKDSNVRSLVDECVRVSMRHADVIGEWQRQERAKGAPAPMPVAPNAANADDVANARSICNHLFTRASQEKLREAQSRLSFETFEECVQVGTRLGRLSRERGAPK
jgi:hypothetical protein